MQIIVVDGYNIIGAWEELVHLKRKDFSEARNKLLEMLAEYKAYTNDRIIVVFDALYVKGMEQKTKEHNLEVIYTKEDETADECIERLVKSLINVKNQVYVATSDYLEQTTIFSRGAYRLPAMELKSWLDEVDSEVQEQIAHVDNRPPKNTIASKDANIRAKLERMRRGLPK